MLPLAFTKSGDEVMVAKIGGGQDVRKHLEDLGFVVGSRVQVISASGDGNIIVNLKGARLAITEMMAQKVQVVPDTEKDRKDAD